MSYQRINRSNPKNSDPSSSSSIFAPRTFSAPKVQREATPEELENQAFEQDKLQVQGLQLKEQRGTITSEESEKLTVLQAKTDSFLQKKMAAIAGQPNILEILANKSRSIKQTQPVQPVRPQLIINQINMATYTSSPTESLQPKLTVGQPNDQYEQEADEVAERVMSMSPPSTPNIQRQSQQAWTTNINQKPIASSSITPLVSRKPESKEEEAIQTKCDTCEQEEQIQRSACSSASLSPSQIQASSNGTTQAQPSLESRLNATKGGGSPLADGVRNFMEPRFGADFSHVQVHTCSEAVQMNRELGAQAFAHGSDIYFGAGKSAGNNELTAHELTHVVQQTGKVQAKLATQQPTRLTYPSNHSSRTLSSSQRIGSSTRLALRPTKLPPVPNAILRQTLQRKVGQKLLWGKFWQVVGKRFGVKIAAAGTAAIADGPLPIGDLISIGLTIWMIWDLIQLWDMLWEETIQELEQEQANPQAIPHSDTEAIPREDTKKQKQDINFYHGTDEGTAKKFQGGMAVRAIGGGEFGQGFYTFIEQKPAEIVAEQYTRNRRPPLPRWGVVKFMIPVDMFIQYFGVGAIADVIQGKFGNILYFPDQQTPVKVTYPDDILPGFEQSFTWKEFVDKNRQLRKENKRDVSWPYDLIIGPLSGKIPGYKSSANQFMFNELGVVMLNNKEVKRNVVAQGNTGI